MQQTNDIAPSASILKQSYTSVALDKVNVYETEKKRGLYFFSLVYCLMMNRFPSEVECTIECYDLIDILLTPSIRTLYTRLSGSYFTFPRDTNFPASLHSWPNFLGSPTIITLTVGNQKKK